MCVILSQTSIRLRTASPNICVFFFSFYQDAEKLVGFDTEAQNLVHCLQVLEVLVSTLHTELLKKVTYIAYFGLFTLIQCISKHRKPGLNAKSR